MSTLMLVPVPGGVSIDGDAVLRVLVIPRLDSGSVADNGLAAWPPAELRGPLQVTFTPDGGADTRLDVTPRLVDQPGLWTSVFGAATVASRASTSPAAAAAAPTGVTVRPSSRQVAQVDDTYRTAAQSVGAPVGPDLAPQSDADAPGYAATVAALLRRPEWANPPAPSRPVAPLDTPPTAPPSDVDRIYGTLREHPRVLAALGLLLELDVPLAAVPAGATGVVRVEWDTATRVTPTLPPVTARSTAYLRDVFLPAPHTDALEQGLVRLDDPTQWTVAAVDVDGAVARLQAGAAASAGTDGAASTAALPAIRTAGLMLLRPGRAADFATRRARAIVHAADPDPVLAAEDLVLGYRIDVRAFGDTAWQPLCTRLATYRIDGALVGTAAAVEEGHVKAHAALRDDAGQLSADEVVTRWDGWSLAVPLPFPAAIPGAAGTDVPGAAGPPYTLDVDLSVPDGTLPALRFGPSYELRARVADVAGGGLAVDDPAADRNGSAAYPFRRYEPVGSPTLQLPDGFTDDDLGPGVHVAQLVVSSDGGSPAATTTDPADPGRTRRTLTRPAVPLTTAEWHGALTGDADATWPVAQLALAGELPDPAADGLAAYVVPAPGTPAAGPSGHRWPTWPDPTGAAVEVRGHPASVPAPTLSWQGDTLVVDLAPAEDVTVQLSSTLTPEDVAHFAVGGWSSDAGIGAATTGRHPMLTPPVEVRCVHAVRRPLAVPSNALTATRGAGLVPVTLTPTTPLFGVDPASTGQIDLTASWTEVTDDVRTEIVDHPVQSLVVDRGATGLAELPRHLLPDTRHRTVTYTVSAVSRFRSWFTDGTDDDYTTTSTPAVVEVPSTVRPVAPVVLAVTPSFVWERTAGPTITRVRRGNRIRVELDRPWFSSGEDERLALVLTPATAGSGTYGTTQVGQDPVWWTGLPNTWPRATGEAAAVTTPDGLAVEVVATEVFFDPDSGHWFGDFDLPGVAGTSYAPMLKPVLARFQPHSLPGLELSTVVVGDFVPVLPDRTLTVTTAAGGDLVVTLSGLAPDGPFGNYVEVVLERGPADTDLSLVGGTGHGWVAEGAVVAGPLGAPLTVPLPPPVPAGPDPRRIRVREVEGGLDPDATSSLGTSDEVIADRAVFSDSVPLALLRG